MRINKAASHLVRHNHKFYFRMAVPGNLRQHLGKTEYRKSLGTSGLSEARDKAGRCAIILRRVFNQLQQNQAINKMTELQRNQIPMLVDKWLRQALDDAEVGRATQCSPIPSEWVTNRYKELEGFKAIAKDHLNECRYEIPTETVDAFLKREGYEIASNETESKTVDAFLKREGYKIDKDKDPLTYGLLCRETLKGLIQFFSIEQQRISGNYSDEYSTSYPIQQQPIQDNQVEQTIRTPLADVIDKYTAEQMSGNNWSDKSKDENHACYNLFLDYAGHDIAVEDITYKLVREYKDALQKLPSNMKKIPKYRDKTIHQILEMKVTKPMSTTTVNKYLNRLSTLLGYAVKNGYIQVNPAQGMQISQSKRDDEYRTVFSEEDLKKLFHSPEYIEGKHKKPFQFWIPLIALFTGMRLEEIAQLHLEDIKQSEDGVWIFDVNDKGDKKLKTSNAKRLIPIHPFLVDDLKLPEYANKLRDKGEIRLFPEIKKARDGYGQPVSRWFNGNSTSPGYKQRCGIIPPKDGSKKDFHSFRHTVINHLKQKQVHDGMLHELDGHAFNSMTMGRYGKRYSPKQMLSEVVSKIDFHLTLDLSPLPKELSDLSVWPILQS